MALTRPKIWDLDTTIEYFKSPMTVLHQGATSANVDVGFLFNRANGLVSNVALYWSESTQSVVTAFTSNTGLTNSNVLVSSYAPITVGNVITTNGVFWANGVAYSSGGGGGSTSPGGVAGQLQYNNSGSFAGSALYYYTGNSTIVSTVPVTLSSTTAGLVTSVLTHGADVNFQLTSQNGTSLNTTGQEVARFGVNYNTAGWDSFTQYIRGSASQNGQQVLWASNTAIATINTSGITLSTGSFSGAGTGLTGTAASLSIGGSAASSTTAGTVTTASQPNITTLAGLTSFGTIGINTTAQGNLTVTGNLNVGGSTNYFSGNIGVGTSSPISKLNTSVGGIPGGNVVPGLTLSATYAAVTSVNSIDFNYIGQTSSPVRLGATFNTNGTGMEMVVYTSTSYTTPGLERVRVDMGGNLLVGTAGSTSTSNLYIAHTTPSTSTTTGALVVAGGAGINGSLTILNTGDVSANIGTVLTRHNTLDANVGSFENTINANVGTLFLGNVSTQANLGTVLTRHNTLDANVGSFETYANTKIGTNTNSNLVVVATTTSTSATTGALVVAGGAGIAGNIYASGTATTGNVITTSGVFWANGYSYNGQSLTTLTTSSAISSPAGITQYNITALATATTINAPAGTPYDGQRLMLRFKDNGTAQALTWTTTSGAFRAVGVTLPTTTVISKVLYVGCIYNAQDTFWDVIAVGQQ